MNILKIFKRKSTNITVDNTHTCSTCRFNNSNLEMCVAGSHWARKGHNFICYSGELWEAKLSDKTKRLK
jgi:hypothetical protein